MRTSITNFTGGEIAPTLSARYDLARYKNASRCMENFFPNLHGAATRRPGTVYLGDLGERCTLLPFCFSSAPEDNYVLIFGNNTMRVANAVGIFTGDILVTPYTAAEAVDISHAQVGDVVYLAHRSHAMQKVTRSGAGPNFTWAVSQVILNTSIEAPDMPTVTFNGAAGSYTLRYKIVAVDNNGKESLASQAGEAANGKHTTDWVVGNSADISWEAVSGAVEYNVYREDAGYFGFIGISTGTSFSDQNYQADVTDTPREDWNPFDNDNHPGVVAFHQQRMVLAGTSSAPQAFYMSRSGDFENFRKSRPLQEDDPVEYHIASGSIDSITWAASFGDLLLGTSGSEYKASGDGQAITVKNIQITAQSYWGSARLKPIIIGNSIMHVQRNGARVRDLFYSLEKDGYAGNDLSILAPHLFEGHSLLQWDYQQTPNSNIWAVRDDGVLLCLTYMKEHDIWGWSRHVTDGKVLSVACLSGDNEDVLMLVVRRTVGGQARYYLERLAPQWRGESGVQSAFFVDCGYTHKSANPVTVINGLGHIEGRLVDVLADGSPVEGLTVQDGAVTLPYPAKVTHVGLPYTSRICPMSIEGDIQGTGTTLGRQRAYGRCTVRLSESVGGKYGAGLDGLFDFPFLPAQWGEPCELFSGDIDCIPGGGQTTQEELWLMQDRPLPFTVTAIAMDVDIAQN